MAYRASSGSAGAGGTPVIGPGTSTDKAVARWSGTSGTTLQNSVVTIGDTGITAGMVSLSINGATIGSNALAVTGTSALGAVSAAALTATSFNGNTFTTGTGVLTLGAGKTLTASNTLAFTGTDGSSVAFGAGGTVLYSGGAGFVSSLTGTANQITVSAATGAVTLSLPSAVIAPGTFAATSVAVGGATIGANALAVTGTTLLDSGTLTADANGLSVIQTWTNGATYTGALKVNVTNTSSNAASLLFDLQVGGSSMLKQVASTGALTINGNVTGGSYTAGSGNSFGWTSRSGITSPANAQVQIANNAGTNSFILTAAGATATPAIQLGATDVDTTAAMIAQTLRTQGALTGGTTNQAGVDFTVAVSPGKGTGAGGSFIVQTASAGSTGSTPNSLTARLTINGAGLATFTGGVTNSNGAINSPVFVATTNATGYRFASGGNFGSIGAQSDGVFTFQVSALGDFGRLQLGGTTSSFPAIKRSAAALAFRLADDSADAAITAGAATLSSTLTVVGGSQLLTTSNALTNDAGAQVATLTNSPTVGNPTKWILINDAGTTRAIPTWPA